MSLPKREKGKKPNHPRLISDADMITNEFKSGFYNDLDAIFGSGAGFIRTASIMPSKFIYGLDEFKKEFEEDLDALLGFFVSVAYILPAEYGKVQDVEELEGDYADSIVGDEWMILR